MLLPVGNFFLGTRIVFGIKSLQELGKEAKQYGQKALLVTGTGNMEKTGTTARIAGLLQEQGMQLTIYNEVRPEPTVETVQKGLDLLRANNLDLVLGAGGGSALDVAKAIAGLAKARAPVAEYFLGRPPEERGYPLITIPTTSGSGAEVTINSVLTYGGKKQSIRSPYFAPVLAVVDPELTRTLPPDITAYTGMDALTQAIESYTSLGANPLTDIYAVESVLQIMRNLPKAYADGDDLEARQAMSLASLMAGIALTNARLGAVHGMAHSVGLISKKPHGLVCAVLLPYVMRFNLAVVYEKYAAITGKIDKAGRFEDPIDAAANLIKQVIHLKKRLGMPERLREIGIEKTDFDNIISESMNSGSLKANPRQASPADLRNILEEAW